MVIGLKRAGWSIRQIAADTHLGASTVHRLWRRWLEQGNVAIYRNVGATRVTSARVDRHILRQAVAAPQATCTAILQHVQDTLDHSNSTRTISRRLVANGLHSCRPLRRLPLTPPNRRQRLEWCRARSTWMTEWHRVVFSDESRFCLSSDSRRVRLWRRRGERSNPAAIVERPTVRQRGIMVWGAIAYDSRSPLLRIQGTMTAQRYVDDVLRPVTLPYLQGVPNALYQQDNARPHTARISQQALQDVQMLPWPPYSPDLSPIEHVWDIIGRRLHALPQPRSEDELWQMVEREWRAIPQDAIRNLIDSLPRRVAACIAVRVETKAKMDCNFSPTTKIEPLTGTNYPIWALKVGALLRGKKLFKCVISDPEPDIKDEVTWQIWSEKNDEAFGIIVTTLSDEQAGMLLDETKAKKVWDELKKIYTGNLEDKIIDIGLELKNIKMKNNESINKYMARAKNIASQSSSLGHQISQRELAFHIVRGCTTHLSSHLDRMENVMPYESEINLAEEGKVTHATAKGDIKVSTCTENGIENVQIEGVLHVPNLRSNLLSIYVLTNKGNTVIFNRDGAKIYNEQDDLIAVAQIQDRMYVMETRSRDEYSEKTENVMTTKDDFSNDNISLWHRRLNHLNEAYMKEIIQRNVVLGFNVKLKNLPECEACIMGKLTRQPYHPVTTNCTSKPLELVHMDLCGPMPHQSLGGSKYFFVLVDDFSRRTFIYFLKNKDETLGKFEEFKTRVENELNLKIKDVRTDNGTEFTNHRFKNFSIKNGIHHQLSTTYSPQSNGVAERVNRTLIETARTLLFDSGLPMAFWAEAVATASYVKNCTPHRSIKLDTPMEKWKGRKPSIRHFRIFGCLAFWPITQQHRSKFIPKIRKGIFVGYSLKRKAYRVYDIITKKIEEPEVFVEKGEEDKVCKLLKSIYGFPQSVNCWNKKINEILIQLGMERSQYDPCVYTFRKGKEYGILGLYVDDLMIAGTDKTFNGKLASEIRRFVVLKEKGENEPFIGIEIKKTEYGFDLSQAHYIDKILKKFALEECNIVQTPGDRDQSFDECQDSKQVDRTLYQEMIGSLVYLATGTRPDIYFNVSNLSRFCNDAREVHLTGVKRIYRYLKGTRDKMLRYKPLENSILVSTDASWCSTSDAKSYSGYTVKLGNNLISWKSKKQSLVALSTCEAELISICEGICEVKWIKGLLGCVLCHKATECRSKKKFFKREKNQTQKDRNERQRESQPRQQANQMDDKLSFVAMNAIDYYGNDHFILDSGATQNLIKSELEKYMTDVKILEHKVEIHIANGEKMSANKSGTLNVFGSRAWRLILPKPKLDARAKSTIMVGYSGSGNRIWDPETDKIMISTDVTFDETLTKFDKEIISDQTEPKRIITESQDEEETPQTSEQSDKEESNQRGWNQKGSLNSKRIQMEESSDIMYAPVARMSTIRKLLSHATNKNWEVNQMEIPTAFLNGNIESDIYIKAPQG
ncbi:hypothetical protein LAZ67_13002147, partial [Cordylochernes scorpioides]